MYFIIKPKDIVKDEKLDVLLIKTRVLINLRLSEMKA
jgi:hypothetical protein